MDSLSYIRNLLNNRLNEFKGDFYIPEAWNTTGFSSFSINENRPGELNVNPYEFILHCIDNGILGNQVVLKKKVQIENSVLYGLFPRSYTAWMHSGRNISGGTFLKAICLLPYIKSLNIDILYLLPIFKSSWKYRKGELPSPYSVKDQYKLDPQLHDPLLGDFSGELLEMQFKAFIESCHMLGIKVMVDFVFRTIARDNDLIKDHPDWFYWIDKSKEEEFRAPRINGLKGQAGVTAERMKKLYDSEELQSFLSFFRHSPDILDPRKWEEIRQESEASGGNILDMIEDGFGITTVPAFSDVINDVQPPWIDVTYLKLYFDVHDHAKKYVPEDHPAYIMQDIIKTNLYVGSKKNEGLWDYITGILPYYNQKFGLDGARIDMAHALPDELNAELVRKVRSADDDFILWSEQFDVTCQPESSKSYNFATGNTWELYNYYHTPSFNKRFFATIEKAKVIYTATLETPDTPRLAFRFKDSLTLKSILYLNALMPKTAMYINSGLDILEIQPMNLGIGNTEKGKYVLSQDDLMYGKLAFFDNYMLHWNSDTKRWIVQLIKEAVSTKKKYSNLLNHPETKFRYSDSRSLLTWFCCYNLKMYEGFVIMVNRSEKRSRLLGINGFVPLNAVDFKPLNKAVEEPGSGGMIKLGCSQSMIVGFKLGVEENEAI